MQQIRQADDGKITALYERLSKDDDFEGDQQYALSSICTCMVIPLPKLPRYSLNRGGKHISEM